MNNIMVVDDSPMIVDVFVAMLERGGYNTVACYSGPECIDKLKEFTPDLILLDIMMEPMDGWETLENIKANPETKSIPVMMLTAKQLTPEEAQEYGAYIEDYLMKPTTHRQLYEAIEYILKRKQNIIDDVKTAKEAGVEQQIIDEYARLSRTVDVSKRIYKILESTYNINSEDAVVGENVIQAIKSMSMSIHLQEERLEQIKKSFI